MWSGSSSSANTGGPASIGAASTATTTAQRTALAGPRLLVTARATAQAATIRYVSAELMWAARLPTPNSSWTIPFSGSSKA